MKPRIFIGSSSEGAEKATFIKKRLSNIADCQVWSEDFFENNNSYFESLNEGATLYDFAIMLATADDVQLKRNSLEAIARDNVLFEFGLYVGRIGRHRSFFMKETGLDLPSDLYGIKLYEFTKEANNTGKTLENICSVVGKTIKDTWKTFELSLVPSTVLAVGYFENFVLKVADELMNAGKRRVNNRDFEEFKLHIVIPDQLPNNFTSQVKNYLHNKKLNKMEVETDTRKYNFYLDYAENKNSTLELYDLPTTLSALKVSIDLALPKSYIGNNKKDVILKKKEMYNFCRTLTYLVKENAITKKRVVVEFIDINEEE